MASNRSTMFPFKVGEEAIIQSVTGKQLHRSWFGGVYLENHPDYPIGKRVKIKSYPSSPSSYICIVLLDGIPLTINWLRLVPCTPKAQQERVIEKIKQLDERKYKCKSVSVFSHTNKVANPQKN